MFSNLGSMTNFENFHFFSTPSEGGWGKKILIQNVLKIEFFLYLEKVKKFKMK